MNYLRESFEELRELCSTDGNNQSSSPLNKRSGHAGKRWFPQLRKLNSNKLEKASSTTSPQPELTGKPPLRKIQSERFKVPPVVQNEMGQRYSGDSSETVPKVPSSPTPRHHELTHQQDLDDEEVELPPPMQVLGDQRLSTNPVAQSAKEISSGDREEHGDPTRIADPEPECSTNSGRSQSCDSSHLPSDVMSDVSDPVVKSDVQETEESRALRKRTYVVTELLNTERDYVKDLSLISEGYFKVMFDPDGDTQMPEDLKDGKAKIVFGNIEQICEWHRDVFLPALEKCVSSPADLGPLFKKYERKFLMYVVYCQNKPKSEYIVSEYIDTYFEDLRQRLGHRLTIADLLIKPVQRLMKYKLLLEDILKLTKQEEEVQMLTKACEIMTVVPKEANDMMNVGRLQGFDGKITAQGKLVHHGRLTCSDTGGQTFKNKDLQVYLFEQAIIFSEVVGGRTKFSQPDFIYKTHIQMNKLQLESSPDGDFKFILKASDPRGVNLSITCQCLNQSQCDEWIEPLNNLLQKQRDFLRAIQSPIDYQKRLVTNSSPMNRTKSMHESPTSPVPSRPTKMLSLDSSKPPALPEKRKSGIPAPSGRNVNNNIDIKVTRTPSLRTERVMERKDDIRRSSFLMPKKSMDEGLLSPKLFGRKNLLEGLKSGLNRSKSKDEPMKEKAPEPSPAKKSDECDAKTSKPASPETVTQEQHETESPNRGWSFKLSRRPSETKPDIPTTKRLSSHELRSPKLSDSKLESPVRKSSQCKSPESGQKVIRKPSMSERPLVDDVAKKPPRPVRTPKSPVQPVQSPVRVRRENWVKSKQAKIIPP